MASLWHRLSRATRMAITGSKQETSDAPPSALAWRTFGLLMKVALALLLVVVALLLFAKADPRFAQLGDRWIFTMKALW